MALPLCVSAGTSAQTTVSAAVKSTEILYSGNASDAFRVAIDLSLGKNEPGIASYIVTVRWDPNVLELIPSPGSYEGTGCYFSDNFSEGWKLIPNGSATLVNTDRLSEGKLTVLSGSAENRARSDGTLFVLNFRPKKGGVNTEITVTPGSPNVSPGAALSSASGRIANVTPETRLSLWLLASAQRGDLDRNGQIDALDYLLLKRHVTGSLKLPDEWLLLADIDRSGEIDALDYLMLKRHVLGSFTIS